MMKKDKDTNDQKSESHMKHNDESKVPEDMKSTNEGEFKVGDKVTITAGHMPGMKGAEATVKGAYMSGMKGATAIIDNVKKTTVYVVDYKSKDNGKIIKNHKWMTGNELKAR